jgi:hypothetical protein
MFAVLRKVWNDSVWSKVIAAGITAAVAAVGSLAFAHWDRLADVPAVLTRPVPLPLWLLLLLGIALVALALRRLRAPGIEDDVQPNAIPVARVHARLLERPFESLSLPQQRFLSQQFRRGTRFFSATEELTEAQWFEKLKKWGYLTPRATGGSGFSGYEIVQAAWQELERASSEAGFPTR